MSDYIICYKPIWGTFTRNYKKIKANSYLQAEIRFLASKEADNCLEIININ